MDEKTAKKLNDDFDEFCQKIGASSALAYFAVTEILKVCKARLLNGNP